MIIQTSNRTLSARLRIVEEHVSLENEHNLDGVMGTFGETARYDDEPWGAHYVGRQQVREFYTQMLRAVADLNIGVQRRAGERIYYDRPTLLNQLGIFHELEILRGRITTALMHPITMARIVARKSVTLRSTGKP